MPGATGSVHTIRSTQLDPSKAEFVAPGHRKAAFGGVSRGSDHTLWRSAQTSRVSLGSASNRILGSESNRKYSKDKSGNQFATAPGFKDGHEVDVS